MLDLAKSNFILMSKYRAFRRMALMSALAMPILCAGTAFSEYINPETRDFNGNCRVVLDGKRVIWGSCHIDDGSSDTVIISDLRLVTACPSKENCFGATTYIKRPGVFLYVFDATSDFARVVWNRGQADRAHAELGTFVKNGSCWRRGESSICYEKR